MRKGEVTRGELITATGRLLAERGVKGTGLAAILERSGAPKGSLYFHFPGGKDELACAALAESARAWRAKLQEHMAPGATAGAAVMRACDALAARLEKSQFTLGCPLATTTLEVASENDPIRAVCDTHFSSWIDYLTELFVGHGMAPADAPRWATLVLSSIEGALLLARAAKDTKAIRESGALLASLVDARARVPERA